jgi:uncharacterized protein
MLKHAIVKTVTVCTRYPWPVIVLSLLLGAVCAFYAVVNFEISTDISRLISSDLPWRQREIAFDNAFPERYDSTLVVVDAPTQEQSTQATRALAQKLSEDTTHFISVRNTGGSDFFRQNGFLFLPADELEDNVKKLIEAEPLINTLAGDPSLRGLTGALVFALAGVQRKQITLDDMVKPNTAAADTIENVLAGRPATFSWQALMSGHPPEPRDLRQFIQVHPVLDFAALEPGGEASDAIRKAAADLELKEKFGARVRLTGPVPISDEEFATVQEGALANGTGTILIVLFILWRALRSPRIIVAVFITLAVGLVATAAVGLWMVQALNLISIAFAVLFVGLGVDFGIQFSVRYRAERHEVDDLSAAIRRAARFAGVPLTLAATATAAGFMSFLPTAYRGISELGQIAGVGMIIAYFTSITLLPALLQVLNPPGEAEPMGYKYLAPVDRFLDRYRMPVLVGTIAVVVLGLPLLYFLRFDFNPLNLRSPKVESVATLLELRGDEAIGANSVQVLAANVDAAKETADRLAKIPQVSKVTTLSNFVPDDQERKLALVKQLGEALGPEFQSGTEQPAPSDAENVEALTDTANSLNKAAANDQGAGAAAARRLAAALVQLAQADEPVRAKAEAIFVDPLKVVLGDLREYLKARPVKLENLPKELTDSWVTPDGRTRVEANPKGDPNDNENLRSFARAVLAVAPDATGGPISILESGDTMVTAFTHAGLWAMFSIALLLWVVLRRFGDVLLTLIPLIMAGVVTLELCVIIGLQLNFANIIALPVLLGIGVAFKIYYIMAWRAGQTDLLQSSLTRAVFWSALTTATAFGSLWLSSHPGTSSMGKLLALSLVCTMAAAVLFQPVLMGKPRSSSAE